MKPINFKEANKTLMKPEGMIDEECGSLPVLTDGCECLSCWKMSWKERLSALLFGRVWVNTLSGRTQPPMWARCRRTVFEKKKKVSAAGNHAPSVVFDDMDKEAKLCDR